MLDFILLTPSPAGEGAFLLNLIAVYPIGYERFSACPTDFLG